METTNNWATNISTAERIKKMILFFLCWICGVNIFVLLVDLFRMNVTNGHTVRLFSLSALGKLLSPAFVELSNYYLFSHRTGSGRVTKIVTTIFQ
jgi:hypothetical protein